MESKMWKRGEQEKKRFNLYVYKYSVNMFVDVDINMKANNQLIRAWSTEIPNSDTQHIVVGGGEERVSSKIAKFKMSSLSESESLSVADGGGGCRVHFALEWCMCYTYQQQLRTKFMLYRHPKIDRFIIMHEFEHIFPTTGMLRRRWLFLCSFPSKKPCCW